MPSHSPRPGRLHARVLVAALTGLGTVAVAAPAPAAPAPAPDWGRTLAKEPAPVAPGVPATSGSVVAISVDGLNPKALAKLGRSGAPTLHKLIDQGASTLNARTEYERTETLPNHTGMVTGRRITAAQGGHGVEWNDDRKKPRTVQDAAGRAVLSVFDVVNADGGSTSVFASKTKFRLWKRSWGGSIDRFQVTLDNAALVKSFRQDFATPRRFRFLHLSAPDVVGHRKGYLTKPYLNQLRATDKQLKKVLRTVKQNSPDATVVLTSDHGGKGRSHADPTKLVNYRIPFVVWGHGVTPGSDLYRLNPGYADPGKVRVDYVTPLQPVRNGSLANLSLDLLGLGPVPGSEHDLRQDLSVS